MPDLLPEGVELRYHAENGILGFSKMDTKLDGDPNIMDAGGNFPKLVPSYWNSKQKSPCISARASLVQFTYGAGDEIRTRDILLGS